LSAYHQRIDNKPLYLYTHHFEYITNCLSRNQKDDRGAMALRIFISYATPDAAFAEKLASDFRRSGADAWMAKTNMQAGVFQQQINQELSSRDVLMLVLTPIALASKWVPDEMAAAIDRSKKGLMREPVVVLAKPVRVADIPPLWNNYHRVDMTIDYNGNLPKLMRLLTLPTAPYIPKPVTRPAPQPIAPVATPPATSKPEAGPIPQPIAPVVSPPKATTPPNAPKVSHRNLLMGAGALAATAAGIGIIVKLANTNQPVLGTLRWRFKTGGQVESSPAVANGLVYVGSGAGYIYALEA
jgi:hypothetical protein